MGNIFNFRRTQPVSSPETEIDLQETVISDVNWETRSWLDYSFQRDVHSVPSSLAASWVNLDFSPNQHTLESATPKHSCRQLEDGNERDHSVCSSFEDDGNKEPNDIFPERLITSTPNLTTKNSITLECAEPAVHDQLLSLDAVRESEEAHTPMETGVLHRNIVDGSRQFTPVDVGYKRFITNRSSTFSGASSEVPSPMHSLRSGNSSVSIGTPNSPFHTVLSLTSSVIASTMDREKGLFIYNLFQANIVTLVEQINPPGVALHLFNLAIINTADLKRASNCFVDEQDRAQAIVLCLMKKLKSKPALFSDIFAALKKSGVEVIQGIRDEIRSRYPDDDALNRSMSILSRGDIHTTYSLTPGINFSVSSGPDSSSSSREQADPSIEDIDSALSALEQAFREDNLPLAQELIAKHTNKDGGVLLIHRACRLEVEVCVLNLLLTDSTCSVNAKDRHGRTPLHAACASLKLSVETSTQQNIQESQLMLKQQRMKIENLLEHGANNHEQDEDGNSPLHLAALRSDCAAVKLLLRHSAECIDLTNRLGNTALHIACRDGYSEVVKVLCDYKANATLSNRTRKQRTPMLEACSHEHVGVAQVMIDYDSSSLDGSDVKKRTPLHMVTKRHNSTLAETLLECADCQPYTLDQDNKTPLHYACYWGSLDLVDPLLKRDKSEAFVNAQDRNGDTALHIASRRGHKRVIKSLLSKKASKSIKNQDGNTPVDVARQCEHKKAAKLLAKKSPWLSRRKKRSSESSMKRVGTQASLTSESSLDPHNDMIVSSSESDGDETVDNY